MPGRLLALGHVVKTIVGEELERGDRSPVSTGEMRRAAFLSILVAGCAGSAGGIGLVGCTGEPDGSDPVLDAQASS
jgi:hypothetical protein